MHGTAAQEDLHDLIDEEQDDGKADAEQPLAAVKRGQAQAVLQEGQLCRQVDEQQGQAIENHLVSIVQDIPVECGLGFAVATRDRW